MGGRPDWRIYLGNFAGGPSYGRFAYGIGLMGLLGEGACVPVWAVKVSWEVGFEIVRLPIGYYRPCSARIVQGFSSCPQSRLGSEVHPGYLGMGRCRPQCAFLNFLIWFGHLFRF